MNDIDRFFRRDTDPQVDQRSPLMRAKAKSRGRIVNACPYGCPDESLDEHTYCKHLIGFTLPGNDRRFHPIEFRKNKDGTDSEFRFSNSKNEQDVLPSDHLERGSQSCRVYRKVPVLAAQSDPGDEQREPQAAKKCKPKGKPKKSSTSPKPAPTNNAAEPQVANAT